MTDNDPKALLRRAVSRLIVPLLAACAVPFALLLFLMRQIGYAWTTSLMAATLLPLAMLAFAAYKLVPLLAKLGRPAQPPEQLSDEELGAIVGYGYVTPPASRPPTAALPVSGNTEQVGWLLYTSYLIPFEIASMLLLVAMIGAIVLAKREL